MRDELDQLRVELGRRSTSIESVKGLSKITFDLPSAISTTFADSLTTVLVKETTDNWMVRYGQLKKYIEENGNCFVPIGHPIQGFGAWVTSQRQLKRQGKLGKDRINLPERLSFV